VRRVALGRHSGGDVVMLKCAGLASTTVVLDPPQVSADLARIMLLLWSEPKMGSRWSVKKNVPEKNLGGVVLFPVVVELLSTLTECLMYTKK